MTSRTEMTIIEEAITDAGFDLYKLTVKGFNRYKKKFTVTFDKKFTSIVGPTGSGKTTFVDALTFSLYSRNARTDSGMKIDEMLEKGGYVVVDFLKDGSRFEVTRGRRSDGSSFAKLKINDDNFKGNIKSINQEVERIIGMDYKSFRASTIIRQGEIKIFSDFKPSERVTALQNLFHLTVFDKALDVVKNKKKVLEKQIATAYGEIEAMVSIINDGTNLPEEIKSLRLKMIEIVKKKKPLALELEDVRANLSLLGKEREELSALLARKENTARNLNEKYEEISNIQQEIFNADETIESLENVIAGRGNVERLIKEIESLSMFEAERASITESIESVNKVQKQRESRYRKLLNKNKGGISIDQYTEIAIETGRIEERVNSKKGTKKSLTAIKKRLDKGKKSCTKGIISDFINKEIDNDIDDTGLHDKMEEVDAKIVEIKKIAGERTTDELDVLMKEINIAEVELANVLSEIEKKKEQIEMLGTERDELVGKLEEEMNTVSEKEKMVSRIDALKESEERLSTTISRIDNSAAELRGIIVAKKEQQKKISSYKDRLDVKKETITTLENELSILTILEIDVFHKSGVGMFSIERVIDIIAMRASEIVNKMSGGEITMIKFIPFKENRRYGFRITVDGRDINSFSGGEKTQINASIRFAIAKYARMKTLFIDEGDLGSLDNEVSRSQCVDVIFSLDKKTIVITHMPEIANRFEKVVRVEKRSGFSVVVEQ
jgi:exonuclease SbcC